MFIFFLLDSGVGHGCKIKAIENFTRVWALELADAGVRVNAIAPGAIRINIWNVPGLSKEAKKHEDGIAATIPFKRFGTPEEVVILSKWCC